MCIYLFIYFLLFFRKEKPTTFYYVKGCLHNYAYNICATIIPILSMTDIKIQTLQNTCVYLGIRIYT